MLCCFEVTLALYRVQVKEVLTRTIYSDGIRQIPDHHSPVDREVLRNANVELH